MARYGARRVIRASSLLPLLLAAAGCVSVPNVGERPEPAAPQSLASSQSLAAPAAAWPADRWWQGYGDAQLTSLIDEALAGAPSLAEAEARLRRALANAQQAGSRLQPQIDASASGGIVQQSENLGVPAAIAPHSWNDTGQVALSLSFDLDLWGRNRANLRAANSDAEASRADLAFARLALSTSIASNYAELARLAALRGTTETYLRLRADTLRVMQVREAQELENHGAVMRAEAGRAAAAADLAAVDEQIDLTRNAIAALMGQGPDRGRAITLPATARLAAFGLPTDVGIDLIGRRPDLVAARLRAEAQSERIRAARAEFYPNISLSALIGLQSLGIGNLLSGGSTFGSVGPAISLPIFSGGRIEGGYRGARADYDAAVAGYNGTLVDALREVADVVTRQRALQTRLAESRAGLAASDSAYRLIEARYRGGLATYLDVLTAEDSLNSSRRAVAELESSAFALDVALVRALGGGFHPNAA